MRWYVVDELSTEDTRKLAAALAEMQLASGMDSLFWLPVPPEKLSPVQLGHKESCGPHVMGLEVEEHALRLELLVRARGRMHCDCVLQAHSGLRSHMIDWLEQLLTDLDIAH